MTHDRLQYEQLRGSKSFDVSKSKRTLLENWAFASGLVSILWSPPLSQRTSAQTIDSNIIRGTVGGEALYRSVIGNAVLRA
jgi:hypothetical protein